MTINEAMILKNAIRARISSLSSIRNANAIKTRSWTYLDGGQPKERQETEPQYDPKKVDAKITELEIFIFKLDSAIKQANAKVEIDITADVDKLLAPIE